MHKMRQQPATVAPFRALTAPPPAPRAPPAVRHCNACFLKAVNWDASRTYDVLGPAGGRPVLMIHGALIGRMSMVFEARAMADKVRGASPAGLRRKVKAGQRGGQAGVEGSVWRGRPNMLC
jgi:hypothetical protein